MWLHLLIILLLKINLNFARINGVNLGGWLVIEGWMFPDWRDTNQSSWRSFNPSGCLAGCQMQGGVTDVPQTYSDSVLVRDLVERGVSPGVVSTVLDGHYANYLGINLSFDYISQAIQHGVNALRVPFGFWHLLKPGNYSSVHDVTPGDFQEFGHSQSGIVRIKWTSFYAAQGWIPGDSVGSNPLNDDLVFYTGGLKYFEKLLAFLQGSNVSVLLDYHAVAGGNAAGGTGGDQAALFTGVCIPSIHSFWHKDLPHWSFYWASIDALKAYIMQVNEVYPNVVKWFTPANEPGGADTLGLHAVQDIGAFMLEVATRWAQPPNAQPSQLVFNLIGDNEMGVWQTKLSELKGQWPEGRVPALDWHVYHGYAWGGNTNCAGRCASVNPNTTLLFAQVCSFMQDFGNLTAKQAFGDYDVFVSEYALANCGDDSLQCANSQSACDYRQQHCYNKEVDFLINMWMSYQGGLDNFGFSGSFFWNLLVGNGYDPQNNKFTIDWSDLLNNPFSFLHLNARTQGAVSFNSPAFTNATKLCDSLRSLFPSQGCAFQPV